MQLVQVEALEQALQGEVQAIQTSASVNVPDGHSATQALPFNF
jgi:hypothetical protein